MFWSVGGLRRKEEVVSFGVIIAASHSFTDENVWKSWIRCFGERALCVGAILCVLTFEWRR